MNAWSKHRKMIHFFKWISPPEDERFYKTKRYHCRRQWLTLPCINYLISPDITSLYQTDLLITNRSLSSDLIADKVSCQRTHPLSTLVRSKMLVWIIIWRVNYYFEDYTFYCTQIMLCENWYMILIDIWFY